MYHFFTFVLILFSHQILLGEGCRAGTLVKTTNGYQAIETLTVGQKIICCDVRDALCYEKNITACTRHTGDAPVQITIGTTLLCVESDHRFYMPQEGLWRKAQDLVSGQLLLNSSFELVKIDDVQKIKGPHVLYDITVEQFHTFCVTQEDIIVHNFVFVFPAVLWGGGFAIAEGITCAKVAAALIAAAVCYSAEKVTGKSLQVEVGADGTFNGRALPFTDDKQRRDSDFSSQGRVDFILYPAGGDGCPCSCGCPCTSGYKCACACGCESKSGRNINKNQKKIENEKKREKNGISKSEYFDSISQQYQPFENGAYKLLKGAESIAGAYYLKWDFIHGEVEAYDKFENHLGAISPTTNKLYKPAVPGRTLRGK